MQLIRNSCYRESIDLPVKRVHFLHLIKISILSDDLLKTMPEDILDGIFFNTVLEMRC